MPKSEKETKVIKILTIDEQKRFLDAAKDAHYFLLYFFAPSTGLRAGEIEALEWENLYIENKTVKVRKSTRLVRKYKENGTY